MRVAWTAEAEQDRINVWEYIAGEDPLAAVRMDMLFSEAAARLADFPELGHTGRIPGTRELFPHERYCMVYEMDAPKGVVWILALVHTARLWPPV